MSLFIAGKLFQKAGEGSGGGDSHNLGWYENPTALSTAHPTAEAGDWAIVGSTDTVWIWDTDTSAWVDTDTKGQVTSVNSKTGAVVLTPSDIGAATSAQGAKADTAVQPGEAVPQYKTMPTADASSNGDIVQFIGTTDSTYTKGYFYKCVSDGQDPATYSWTQTDVQPAPVIPDPLPSQTGNTGKFLTTNGTDASWSDKPLVNTATGNNSITLLGTPITEEYGVNIGYGSVSNKGYSVAIGYEATTTATNQVAIGYQAKIVGSRTYNAVVIGRSATSKGINNTYTYGTIAIGNGATIGDGLNAINGAMQFGMGTNLESGTVCFALSVNGSDWTNYKLLDSDGTIPKARLTNVVSTPSTMPTLAVADWSSNTQTVNVTGVTATNTVFVSPAPASMSDYASAGITCTAQGAGTLTFTCTTVPTNAITVNVVIL